MRHRPGTLKADHEAHRNQLGRLKNIKRIHVKGEIQMIFTKGRIHAEHTRFENECMQWYCENPVNRTMEVKAMEEINENIECSAPMPVLEKPGKN